MKIIIKSAGNPYYKKEGEITTLEDLLKISEEYGHALVISKPVEKEPIIITIYDDYLE